MSRHSKTVKNGCTIVAGWDPPLQTYFAQLYKPGVKEGEDGISVWLGADPGTRYTEVEELARSCYSHGVDGSVIRDMSVTLERDKELNR